jgi:hypothetical protein
VVTVLTYSTWFLAISAFIGAYNCVAVPGYSFTQENGLRLILVKIVYC